MSGSKEGGPSPLPHSPEKAEEELGAGEVDPWHSARLKAEALHQEKVRRQTDLNRRAEKEFYKLGFSKDDLVEISGQDGVWKIRFLGRSKTVERKFLGRTLWRSQELKKDRDFQIFLTQDPDGSGAIRQKVFTLNWIRSNPNLLRKVSGIK